MCTASWSVGESSLTLCFSRDERKTRSEAEPPRIFEAGGIRYVAAIDPDGGGTWAAVNDRGLCVFLLNNYRAVVPAGGRPSSPVSRGTLPIGFARYASKAKAIAALRERDLSCYNPFILCFADRAGVEGYAWNGESLSACDLSVGMVTTCAYRSSEIETYRKKRYEELSKEAFIAEVQRQFHLELRHTDPAFNVLMLREESRTHSLATVKLEGGRVELAYEPVIGEQRRLGERTTLILDTVAEGADLIMDA